MIPWRPIAELPDELKDGREVLLWDDGVEVVRWGTHHPLWDLDKYGSTPPGPEQAWLDNDGMAIHHATHFAEITPP